MTLDFITIAFLALFAILGFLIGFAKGLIKSAIRVPFIIISILIAVFVAKAVADQVVTIEIDGAALPEFIISQVGSDLPEGIDGAIYPLIIIVLQIVCFILVNIVLLLVTKIFSGIINLILKPIRKALKKRRLLGGVVGLASGLIVALSFTSVISGLVPRLNDVFNMKIDGDKTIAQSIEIDETLKSFGVDTYEDSTGCKVGGLLNFLVYDNISKVTIKNNAGEEVTYTLDSTISGVSKALSLVSAFTEIGDVNFDDPQSVSSAITALKEIDFSNMSEEEEAFIDNMLETVADSMGLDLSKTPISAEVLGSIDFDAVADTIDIASKAQNGETVTQQEVSTTLGKFINKKGEEGTSIVDLMEGFDVDFGSMVKGDFKDTIDGALDDLKASGEYNDADIEALRSLFTGSGGSKPGEDPATPSKGSAYLAY